MVTTQIAMAPCASDINDIGVEDDKAGDDGRGYECDETDQFHQVVRHLVAIGDTRAKAAGRTARRNLADMAPGYTQQPVLRLTRPLAFRPTDTAQLAMSA